MQPIVESDNIKPMRLIINMHKALRLMGAEDYLKGLARTDLPGDFGGEEIAWLEGWDEARRKAEHKSDKPQP